MSSPHEKGAWVICIASLSLVVISSGLLLLGTLELSGLLGPLQIGPCSFRTWRAHNILACLLWLPTLGAAAWLLADSAHEKSSQGPGAVEGGRLIQASLAMAVIMIFCHAAVIVAYSLRAHLRAKAMKELPSQQLLSCAQQVTRSNLGPSTAAAGPGLPPSSTIHNNPNFRLQFGRSDGAFGYTLFIPAEQEEEELRRAMQNYQPHSSAEAGVPLASNLVSSNTAVGPAGSAPGAKKLVKMRTLREVMELPAGGGAVAAPAPAPAPAPPVVSFPRPSRSSNNSRNPSPYRRQAHEPGESRTSWHSTRSSAGTLPLRPLDPEGVALAFAPAGSHADQPSTGPPVPLQAADPPHRDPPPPPPAVAPGPTAPWPLGAGQQYAPSPAADTDRPAMLLSTPAAPQPFVLGALGVHTPLQPSPYSTSPRPPPQQHPGVPPALEATANSAMWAQPQAPATPAPPLLLQQQGSATPTVASASPSLASSLSLQPHSEQPGAQPHPDVGLEDPAPHSAATIAAWDEPEEPFSKPSHSHHNPGRLQRRRQQQHRRTRSHPVESEGVGDRLDVSLLGAGSGSPEQADVEEGGREGGVGSLRAKSGGLVVPPAL